MPPASSTAPPPSPSPGEAPVASPFPLGPGRRIIPLGLALLLIVVAGIYYASRRANIQEAAFRELDLNAELKAGQLSDWRNARLSEARFFMQLPAVATDVAALLANPDSPRAQLAVNQWLSAMKGGEHYEVVLCLDAQRRVVLSLPPTDTTACPHVLALPSSTLAGAGPYFSDLHQASPLSPAHFDLVAPIAPPGAAGAAPIAHLLFRINPEQNFFPLLQHWPAPTHTAETLLARKDGDEVVFLNPLRNGTVGALGRRQPIDTPDLPTAVELRTGVRVRAGKDDRGVPVLISGRTIPDTGWTLVVKIDQEEVFSGLRREAWATASLVLLLLLCVALTRGYLGRTRHNAMLARALAAEQKGKGAASRLALISQYANDIILLADHDQHILEANVRAQQAYGLSLEDLRRRRLCDLRSPAEQKPSAGNPTTVWPESGALFETEHMRTDGTTFPVEVNGRRIEIEGQPHLLGVIRDISERKKSELARREEEQRHRLLVAASPLPTWLFDPTSLAFLEVNDAAVRHYGFSREEFLQMTLRALWPPAEAPALLAEVQRPTDRAAPIGPWRHRRKDGSELMVEITSEDLQLNGRAARLVVAIDVTARLHAEQTFRDNEERYRQLFEHSLDGLLFISDDGQILGANPAATRLFGQPEAELRRAGYDAMVDPTDPRLAVLLAEREQHGQAQGELRLVRADGTTFSAEVKSTLCLDRLGRRRASLVIHDISTRLEREAALRESEQNLRLTLESVPEAVFIQTHGHFSYLNPTAVSFFGAQSADELVQHPVLERLAPEFQIEAMDRIRRLNTTEQPLLDGEFLRLDGTRMHGEITAVPFRWQGADGALVFVRDITTRKRVGASLRESEARAQEILAVAPAAFYIQSEGRFTYLNASALRLFGTTDAAALLGRPLIDFVVPESAAIFQASLQLLNVQREALPRAELKYQRLDGAVRELEVSSIPFPYNGVPGALTFARDITEERANTFAVAAQLEELRRWQAITLGRETRLLDLKCEVNELLLRAGDPPRYHSPATESSPPKDVPPPAAS